MKWKTRTEISMLPRGRPCTPSPPSPRSCARIGSGAVARQPGPSARRGSAGSHRSRWLTHRWPARCILSRTDRVGCRGWMREKQAPVLYLAPARHHPFSRNEDESDLHIALGMLRSPLRALGSADVALGASADRARLADGQPRLLALRQGLVGRARRMGERIASSPGFVEIPGRPAHERGSHHRLRCPHRAHRRECGRAGGSGRCAEAGKPLTRPGIRPVRLRKPPGAGSVPTGDRPTGTGARIAD